MAELPSGTVTFLLTDVEGSTALWEAAPEAMRVALARHDALFDEAVRRYGGVHIRPRGEGDSRFAVFASALDAVGAAVAIQRAFAAEPWTTPRPISVRIGVHTGEAELRDGDYYGSAVNRCARLRGIGYGGQVLLSEATTALVRDGMPSDVRLLDLGRHRLKDLTEPECVAQIVATDLASDFPPLVSLDARPHNLPTHPTALLGRERELAEVRPLFEDGARLVTLTGPGGTGKTRLGLQVAADLLDTFEHGVFLVELASISDPVLVPSTVAQALSVRDIGSRPIMDALKEHLWARSLLLLLDNFEQVLPAASVVADLLAACPGLAVLATSREPLRLRGEHEYAVPPLALPDAARAAPDAISHYAAVALFLERARTIRADFSITDENAASVTEICARLDGLPLAIELAAARTRLLPPEAMLSRLGHGLSLLAGGRRDAPARQQTLRTAITWSHDLLEPDEQRLFRRLGIFVGGFTLEAVEAVCDAGDDLGIDVLDGVESLLSKCLVKQQNVAPGDPRFTMLETIREYAVDRLNASGETRILRRRHLAWFLALAEEAWPKLTGPEQGEWLTRLEADHDNLRAALSFGHADPTDVEIRLARAMHRFWWRRGHLSEGRAWLRRALERDDHPPDRLRAEALNAAGVLARAQGDEVAARVLFEEGLASWRRLADRRGIANALHNLASVMQSQAPDAQSMATLLEESLALWRELGDPWGIGSALSYLGTLAERRGDDDGARTLLEESLTMLRAAGDTMQVAWTLNKLGRLAREQRDQERSQTLHRESLLLCRQLGATEWTIQGLEGMAHVARAVALPERSVRLNAAAQALRDAIGKTVARSRHAEHERELAAARTALGKQAFAAAWAEGRAMTLEQAVAFALDEPPSA
jgi:predicted ATPase/class 3 adenylate cyclase